LWRSNNSRESEVNEVGKYKRLVLCDRKKIEKMYSTGSRVEDIASRVGVSASTVWRELNRGSTGEYDVNHRPAYNAELADKAVQEAVRRRGRRRTAAKISE